MLSRSLYAQIGKKGVYTRRKGLDRNTNKALLLEHIRDNAETGARFEEMHQVLPSLSRHQIQALLKDLKKDGRVYNEGRTRAARWFPASKDI
jgi:ATP-dependent DNA helicase RecG